MSRGRHEPAHAGEALREHPLAAKRYLVLVEDNPDDAVMVRMALQRHRVLNEIVAAADGETALAILTAPAGPNVLARGIPALVLLDLVLPGIDGVETLRRLRAHPRGALVPVVVMSSRDDPRAVRAAYEAGANSFVRKPPGFDGFASVLGEVAAYWLSLNHPPVEVRG